MASSSFVVHTSRKNAATTEGSRSRANASTNSSNRVAVSGLVSAGTTLPDVILT